MSKTFLKIFTLLMLLHSASFARVDNPYDELYYEKKSFDQDDEGKLLFKLRGFGAKLTSKNKNLPPATNPNPKGIGKIFSNGFGVEAATTYFITDNIAAELAVGGVFLRSRSSALKNIAHNYNGASSGKSKHLYLIPVTVTGQYSIAPYGGIQPYVGAGGHATYAISKVKNVKIKHGFGPVMQVGVDLVAKDYTLINVDLKQYLFSPKVSYKAPLVGSNFGSKVKLNPLVVALGLGFKF